MKIYNSVYQTKYVYQSGAINVINRESTKFKSEIINCESFRNPKIEGKTNEVIPKIDTKEESHDN